MEKASAPEVSYRYASVREFIKAIEHAQRKHLIDKIPLLRRIPGYRSHTWWKMLMASCVYGYLAVCLVLYCLHGEYLTAAVFALADLILPWTFCFDIFDLTHYLPDSIRRSRLQLRYFQILIVILCIALPWAGGLGFPGVGLSGKWGIIRQNSDAVGADDQTFGINGDNAQLPEASEETYQAAITAYERSDYQMAILNLTACKDAGWDGFAVYQYLADSYYAEGSAEQAVNLLADYLQNIWGTVNIQENNVLYQRYLTWLPETSAQTQTDLQDFTEQAAHYSAIYTKARNILKGADFYGLDASAVELKNAGADNTLFWEIYMEYLTNFKDSMEAWEEISPQMYITDIFHSRQMTYEERLSILNRLRSGTLTGEGDSEEWKAVDDFAADSETYADCGQHIGDTDPATGCDINGKIKNFDDQIAAAKAEFSTFTAIAQSPFYEWDDAIPYWIHGNEELRIEDTYDDSEKAYAITHTLGYSWMDDLIYQQYICWDLPEEGYLSATLDVQMNPDPATYTDTLESLVGTWKLANSEGNRVRELVISDIENEPSSGDASAVLLKVSVIDTVDNIEVLPTTWLTFENNKCEFTVDDWQFEIILGRQIYCADDKENDISRDEGIDAIMFMNVEVEDGEQEDCDGVYLRE